MMKKSLFEKVAKTLFTIVLFSIIMVSYAENQIVSVSTEQTKTQVIKDNQSGMDLQFHFGDIVSFDVKTPIGMFTEIKMKDAYSTNRIGEPSLPAQRKLISIPFGAEVNVSVNTFNVSTYDLAENGIKNSIMPAQYSIPKNMDVADIPFEYSEEAYAAKNFNQSEIATVEVLGVMRGVRIARVTVEPVRYNPATNQIEVYNDIEVSLSYDNADWAQTENTFNSSYSPFYDVAYNKLLNVNNSYDDHPDLLTFPVHMLIVADPMFTETLQPFIEWKTKMGYYLTVAYTDEIGSSTSEIQSWVHNEYNTGLADGHAPDFVVFVGDVQQIPASATGSASGKKTDLYYGSVDGDIFPEMYYGRMSAQNTSQLEAMLDKILYYQKYEFADPTYLDDVTLIAGADGTWNPNVGQATIQYGTENYFNAAHGYDDIWVYLSSYNGCYDAERINVGFINYTAHCSETSWGDPNLSISDVNAFQNEGKYPLAIGNCCLAADFGYNECIGEAWMRAENKGAVGYIGSSPSSYWFEDFYWSVGAFPVSGNNNGYVPTFEETTMGAYDAAWGESYFCQDALVFVGNLSVTEVHSQGWPSHSSPTYYWQAYNTIGDPSLMPYHTQGSDNTVSHMDIVPIGVTEYEVSAEPGSYVAISKAAVLHGTGYVDATGTVMVQMDPIVEAGDVDIVVTRQQYIPYVNSVAAAALEGPFLSLTEFVFDNGTNELLYGATGMMDLSIKNLGTDACENVTLTLLGDDAYCSLTSATTISIGNINANETVSIENAFTFTAADNAPDGHVASFQIEMEGTAKEIWVSDISVVINAPSPTFGSYTIDDSNGNNNAKLDPGETVDVIIQTHNNGHAATSAATVAASTNSPYLNINTTSIAIDPIPVGGMQEITINITVASNTPEATLVDLSLDYSAGNYTANTSIQEMVGLIIEDFETGDFTQFDWQFNSYPWYIVGGDQPYEGDYAARSKSITHSQSSILEIDYTVATDDEISFYYKVSSESGYDYLRFYIDDVEQDKWSGTVAWTEASYNITAGEHQFKWAYTKDGSVSNGDDAAWLDNILLPASNQIQAHVYINPENQEVSSQEVFYTTIAIHDAQNLAGFECELSFNPDHIQANSISLDDFLGSTGRSIYPLNENINNTSGSIAYAITSVGDTPPGPNGSGNLMTIEWQVADGLSADVITDINLDDMQLTQVTGDPLATTLSNGQVDISACYPQDFDCDCDVDIVDITMATYTYGTAIGDVNYNLIYDMDSDGDIDILDITTIAYNYGWTCSKENPPQLSLDNGLNTHVLMELINTLENSEGYHDLFVNIENVDQLGAFELSLSFDAHAIEIIDIEGAKMLDGTERELLPLINEAGNGLIKYAISSLGSDLTGAHGGGELLKIRYLVKGNISNDFQIEHAQLARIDGQEIPFKRMNNEISKESKIQNIYPNPFKNQSQVDYLLSEDGPVIFYIYNVFGERVYSENLGVQEIGNHSFVMVNESLNSGTYYIKMLQNEMVKDMKSIVIVQ